jgi:hypothetical protein
MLTQIHETLCQGIRELLSNQANHFEKTQAVAVENVKKSFSLSSTQFLDGYFEASDTFQNVLTKSIQSEVKKALNVLPDPAMARRWSQQSLMSPLEAKEAEVKQDIDRELEAGNFEKAFTTALGSTDLSIVLVSFFFCFFIECLLKL